MKKTMLAMTLVIIGVIMMGCKPENDPNNQGGDNGGGAGDDTCAYVDLGLPNGTLWAKCNVGANSPEEYGKYYAWGETDTKSYYKWQTYKYCTDELMTKYCSKPEYGYNGYTDKLTVLEPLDDVASAQLGGAWCIPTEDQWKELLDHTTSIWTTYNGKTGRLFTAANGNSIFLPAAGSIIENSPVGEGNRGFYRSSTLDTDMPNEAWTLEFSGAECKMMSDYRFCGRSIRPVRR